MLPRNAIASSLRARPAARSPKLRIALSRAQSMIAGPARRLAGSRQDLYGYGSGCPCCPPPSGSVLWNASMGASRRAISFGANSGCGSA